MSQVPCLVMISGCDEYVPVYVDKAGLGRRLVDSIGQSAQLTVIDGAGHSLEGHEEEAAGIVVQFVADLSSG